MMYSSGRWPGDRPDITLEEAMAAKIDFFADAVLPASNARVLDVGCGWGGNLRRLVEAHDALGGVGLTLSDAQFHHLAKAPIPGTEVRLESWSAHTPDALYDAIFSYGAFEHFARDGSTGPERIGSYRRFFARCYEWLQPDGRVALETIAHDDAPDTSSPLGRGPLGDHVLSVYPESLCPHVSEVVLGFEPWFEVELLRCDASDFARTCREWLLGLRRHRSEAEAAVGEATAAAFHRYLVASELQFRLGAITTLRLGLHRRPAMRR
jgi:cyclopropane-fatty-acyl-phospholipid synthase